MLRVYDIEEKKEWDEIVKSFPFYDVYWLNGYAKAFKIHGDGTPQLFYYDDGNTRGINVIMKRDIADDKYFIGKIKNNQYFDFATPYGYGGWIIDGGNAERLLFEYDNYCKNNNIVSEFVRFHPLINNHLKVSSFYEVIALGQTVAMDLSSDDKLLNDMTSQCRNKIRKAKKNSIVIEHCHKAEIIPFFKNIYNSTMDRDNAEDYYYFDDNYYRTIINDLSDNVEFFYARKEEKIIAAAIMLFDNIYMNYHLSGALKEYTNLAPMNLLIYEAALWGREQGYKTLYLGGGVGSEEDSLLKFKKSFYKMDDCKRYYIGKKIFDETKYKELVNLKKNNDDNFFPKYRQK